MTVEVQLEFEEIARGYYLEALLIDDDDIWYTDVARGGVRRVGSGEVVCEDRTMIGGLLLNDDGSLLISGADGVVWVNPKTQASGVLVAGLGGVNEMRSDGAGGMVFGTIDLSAILLGKRPGPSSIYRLSRDQDLAHLWGNLAFANGLALSADGGTLYFNESFAAVRSFAISSVGDLSEPRVLADKLDCDGMALDADGNVWITGFSSGELLCMAPDGAVVRRLALPGDACTNVRFGGHDKRDLYVTIVDTAAAQRLAQGAPLTELSSTLMRARSPVQGAPFAPTSFQLAS